MPNLNLLTNIGGECGKKICTHVYMIDNPFKSEYQCSIVHLSSTIIPPPLEIRVHSSTPHFSEVIRGDYESQKHSGIF